MITERLTQTIAAALNAAHDAGELPDVDLPPVALETPPNPEFGDYSTNVAMLLASQVKRSQGTRVSPREIADTLIRHLERDGFIERVDVAGAGFMNFHLTPTWLHDIVRRIHAEADAFGRTDAGRGRRVQVEFVSANPNGPISATHARGATIGDVLANLLAWTGWRVEREFYINDAGAQMERFGRSVEARYFQALDRNVPVPEDGYHGDYVEDLAKQILAEEGEKPLALPEDERLAYFTKVGRDRMLAEQKATLERYGVTFDVWFSEKTLHEAGTVLAAVMELKERGTAYDAEGATWLRSTEFGDDKDRALIRSNGVPTYIAADIAYHKNKFERGFDRVVDIWGADHHGYIARTKAGVQAFGYRADQIDILIYQNVRLLLNGEPITGSKRAGAIIPLDDVMDEVGRDAARFFYLLRSANSPLDFDLDLAKRETPENPVFYVQMGHARACNIFAEAGRRGITLVEPSATDLSALTTEPEKALIRRLGEFPLEVAEAARLMEPHRLTNYSREVATLFHKFFEECPVLREEPPVRDARLALVGATRIVLRNVLAVLGISAPERMEQRAAESRQ